MAEKYSERAEKLARQYVIALRLSNQLIDSGLLEKKIKVTVDNFDTVRRPLLVAMASDLREAERNSDTFSLHKHDRLAITEAYFDELAARGSEWEYADLKEEFARWQRAIRESMDDD